MILIELRRGSNLLFAVALFIAQFTVILSDKNSWWGIWSEASAAVSSPWFILGPVTAAYCAWAAIRRCSPRSLSDSANGSLKTDTVVHTLTTIGTIAAVPLVTTAIVWLTLFFSGTPEGPLGWQYVIHATVAVIVSCAVGFLFGQFGGPIWFAPAVAFFVVFMRFALVVDGFGESTLRRVFSDGYARYVPTIEGAGVAVIEAALAIALALLIPRAWIRLRERISGNAFPMSQRHIVSGLASILGIIGAGVLVGFGPDTREEADPATVPLCTDSAMPICIWPQNATHLPELERIADRTEVLAQSLEAPLPDRIQELGFNFDHPNFSMVNGTSWFLASDLGDLLAYSIGGWSTCEATESDAYEAYSTAVGTASALIADLLMQEDRPFFGTTRSIDNQVLEQHSSDSESAKLEFIKTYVLDAKSTFEKECSIS